MTDESEQLPAQHLDLLGPIDYLVVELPGRRMPGPAADLVRHGGLVYPLTVQA
jgi:hypothetical protein